MAATMSDASRQPYWLLRRRDQATVAVLVVVALAATFGWWMAHGGWSNRLVDVDRAEPRTANFEVDVNTADCAEVMQLPGIGSKLAQRIIESRETDGPFTSVDDLRRVKGIGKKVMERIRLYVRVAQATSNPDRQVP
jgi:competence protein ComEA